MLIITRGLTTDEENLLCTRGYLGVKVPIYPSAGLIPASELGIKTNLRYLELCYKVKGITSYLVGKEYDIIGTTLFPHKSVYILTAKSSHKYIYYTNTIGILSLYYNEKVLLNGVKSVKLNEEEALARIEGIKKYLLKEQFDIEAKSKFNIEEVVDLYGIKRIEINENVAVEGKRSLIAILESLDLI